MKNPQDTHELVQKAYAGVARKQSSCSRGPSGQPASQAGSCCGDGKPYTVADHPVPEAELGLSCGNPLAFGHINKGDVVLDLGSGAGKDVFLAAQKVGEAGRAIGVDMTPEMLALARGNAVKFFTATGLANVEFRQGLIEDLPVEDAGVDVVISNCVINLSTDKPRVFREVYRVLKPGGRMIVSDIVLNRPLPESVRDSAGLYASCIAGALLRDEYIQAILDAGFEKVEILSDISYKVANAGDDPITRDAAALLGDEATALSGAAASISVFAVK
jgi:SAM-dependent methyltransferase